MVSFEIGKEIEKNVLSRYKHGTKKKFWVLMRNQTSELWIPLSDAPPLSHRDSIVSEVYYEEVYYEVPTSIPHRDSKFFLCATLLTTQKHLSLVQWKFKRGQLFAALHKFENSSNTDAAIQIFLCHVLTQSCSVIFAS